MKGREGLCRALRWNSGSHGEEGVPILMHALEYVDVNQICVNTLAKTTGSCRILGIPVVPGSLAMRSSLGATFVYFTRP